MAKNITVYEEYRTPADKRTAQRGATRAKPTGKAIDYLFIPTRQRSKFLDVCSANEGHTIADREYIRTNCRRIGAKHLTGRAFNTYHNL